MNHICFTKAAFFLSFAKCWGLQLKTHGFSMLLSLVNNG